MPALDLHLDLGENFYDPHDFVDAAVLAEQLGFSKLWLGDHFVPWFHSGNKSAFVWSVMTAALSKTEHLKIGPLVSTPIGGRYHPALVAQASATIDNMYPGRFILAVGTGEAINEISFFGNRWPKWNERIERLTEGVRLIRTLWQSEQPFAFEGKYFSSNFYYLYTKPKSRIPIYFSAIGKRAAYFAGKYGDHLVTLCPRNTSGKLKEEIIPAFALGRRESGQEGGEVLVYLNYTFRKPDEFLDGALKVRHVWLGRRSWDLETPLKGEKRGKEMTLDELKGSMHFLDGWEALSKTIEEYRNAGATAIVLSSGANMELIRDYAKTLLGT